MSQDFDELYRQIDDLLGESGDIIETADDGIDLVDFMPPGTEDDEPVLYPNFNNGYKTVRNFANGYAGADVPTTAPKTTEPEIPAYNADFRQEIIRDQKRRKQEYRDYGEAAPKNKTRAQRKSQQRKKRPGCCGCGCSTVLILLAAMVAAVFLLLNQIFAVPVSDNSIGVRKEDTATVLLCGTDADGTRTDTMMLIYLSGEENRVSLLSLPRDTLTRTSSDKRAKLNSAYGRNGCGEEGMEVLLDYVADIIGYEPDGYILVDMTLVPRVVDLMGGLDMTLEQDIHIYTDEGEIYVPAGDQHLNGEEVLATLRYRAGYANADLGRIQVQRQVIKSAMEQWVTPTNLSKLPQVLEMIQTDSLTNLETNHFLWVGKTILLNIGDFSNDTLPGYADMLGGASYYILYRDQVAELINERYNPYTVDISPEDLTIAED